MDGYVQGRYVMIRIENSRLARFSRYPCPCRIMNANWANANGARSVAAIFTLSAAWVFLALLLVFSEPARGLPHNGKGDPAARKLQGQAGHTQQHLAEWLQQHKNLSLEDQERALHHEPGFNRLPPAVQQRLTDRLRQLDAMPPEQRERTLQSMEALEKLSPEKRQQVRAAMLQVGHMPADRQRLMHKAFRDLRQLPPEQRAAVLESPAFKSQFSAEEREILDTVMSVEPYLPSARASDGIEYGGKQ